MCSYIWLLKECTSHRYISTAIAIIIIRSKIIACMLNAHFLNIAVLRKKVCTYIASYI